MPRAGSVPAAPRIPSRPSSEKPAPAQPSPTTASPAAPDDDPAAAAAIAAIQTEHALYLPHLERVTAAIEILRAQLGADEAAASSQPGAARAATPDPPWLPRLLPILATRAGAVTTAVFALAEDCARASANPWPILTAMLAAQDATLQRRALDALVGTIDAGRLTVNLDTVRALAARVDEPDSPLADAAALAQIDRVLTRLDVPGSGATRPDPRVFLLEHGDTMRVRRLAARILDLPALPPDDDLARRLLGATAHAILGPYLAFTRASHQDLIDLLLMARTPGALASFRRAEEVCGVEVLREAVTSLGWPRLNLGLEARPIVSLSLAGSFPLLVSPAEALLFAGVPDARRVASRVLVVAAGGRQTDDELAAGTEGAVARFRAYNVVHADVLADLLDVAPLTRDRLAVILDKMTRLVDDFCGLFGGADAATREEAASLRRVYAALRDRIADASARSGADPLSMEVCRLVLPFEDAARPETIRTLHGLKRYLHQRGLKLAFSLIGAGPRTTKSVDLAVVTPGRAVDVGRHIEFVDLEAPSADGEAAPAIPEAVRVAVDALSRQMLHGQRIPSHLRVFCYGNEVHYFARFRNHPAFIRIDYSPPLRGGMIDLQYLGVSNYELDVHPCTSLDAIRHVLERLDFVVSLDATRIHARYDKERAVTVDQLRERAALLFHLVPYLMDLDWAIGSLQLPDEARRMVAAAWTDFFVRWGVMPYDQFLTRDRAGILAGLEDVADGTREIRWTGDGPYRDRFSIGPPDEMVESVRERIGRLGIEPVSPLQADDLRGQLALDARVLRPLDAAVARGQVIVSPEGLEAAPADRFERIHEVDWLAGLLDASPERVAEGVYLARAVPLIERHVRFVTSGSINGYAVQRAQLAPGGTLLTMCVLRDGGGMPRLACASEQGGFWRRRADAEAPWQTCDTMDVAQVLERLRRANILGGAPDPTGIDATALADDLRRTIGAERAAAPAQRDEDARLAPGTTASPGRAAGLARFGTRGRRPQDMAGAILCAPGLDPADAPFLFHAAAVVATGGGILSHLGLAAVESGKPALIVDAAWAPRAHGRQALCFKLLAYEERTRDRNGYRLVERHHLREVVDEIHDGDLIVVDADRGALAVLGHDAHALVLFESLRQHAAACRDLDRAGPDEVLVARGHHLRTRHQLEKVLARTTAAPLARFVVEEILLGSSWTGSTRATQDGGDLLRSLAARDVTGAVVRETAQSVTARLAARVREARELALRLTPLCATFHDVLALRVNVAHPGDMLRRIAARLEDGGLDPGVIGGVESADLDVLARARLDELRREYDDSLADAGQRGGRLRRLAELDRLTALMPPEPRARRRIEIHRRQAAAQARKALTRLARRLVIRSVDGGLELEPLVGAKAANLAEAARILGEGHVPAWFAVTDAAFQAALNAPANGQAHDSRVNGGAAPPSVRAAIESILNDPGAAVAAQAAAIRAVWLRARLPEDVAAAVGAAYRDLGADSYVALRSSAGCEDTEGETRAGQFDTFLFVRGEGAVLEHLRLAWSGFWSERALHDRKARHDTRVPAGGIVVQRMVLSRVSGVAQTVNAAESRPLELVINVGLGLGEGIVSGAVAADHVVVAKESLAETAPRFRYVTADKRERVVFNDRFGRGTARVETLAHQRLRPALEYPELCALVEMARRLERAYGHPVDFEFGFDESTLHLLQVRPVPAALAVWRDTMETHPFGRADAAPGVSRTRPVTDDAAWARRGP